MKRLFRHSYLLFGSAALLILLCAGAVAVYWRASATLRTEQREADSGRTLKFVSHPLAPPVDNFFEYLSSPAQFREATQFNGHLYVASAASLTEYDPEGHSLRDFRVGRELPSAPLTRLITATLPGSRKPELVLATDGAGVLAFDGTSFRQILPERRDARSVTALLMTSSGELLIGTHKAGLLVYDGHELRPFHATLANVAVTELAGVEGDLWIGTADRGVAHFHGGTTDWFSEPNGLPDPHVYAIAVASDATFVGTATGVAQFDRGQFARVLAGGAFVRSLLIRDKTLLAGTMDDGLLAIPLRTSGRAGRTEHERYTELKEVHQLFATDDALVAVADKAIFVRSGSSGWQKLISPGDRLLNDGNISALAMDRTGKLWVGYFDRGLDVVDIAAQRTSHIEDDHVFCINRVLPNARKGVTAVATANGLVLFDEAGGRRQVLGRKDGLIADHVTDIAPFGDGLALATPAGLTFLDSTGARSIYAFHGLVNNHVYALAADGNHLLAGTLGGASVLDGDTVRVSYTTATSALKHNWITAAVPAAGQGSYRNATNNAAPTAISMGGATGTANRKTATNDGGFWLGTYGAGVVHMDVAGHFQPADGASGDLIINPGALVADEDIVAAGTLGRGLYTMDRASGRWRPLTDGLPSLNVTALTIAGGYLYVGTDNGLVRIAEKRLLQ
jgi:ligand-binding sensor domain-containing protein